MCDFLSAVIRRDGQIFANGVHGHTELAARYVAGENGVGHQRFWEWESAPPWTNTLWEETVRGLEGAPVKVRDAARELHGHLQKLDGRSSMLPWLAVLRGGSHGHLPADVRVIVLFGDAEIQVIDGAQTAASVWDSAQIHSVWGSAQIHSVWDSAQIMHDYREPVEEAAQ